MANPKKKITERGTTAMDLYVDADGLFRVRVHLDKEIDDGVDLAFEEGGAATPGKALKWAGKILDEILAGSMYDDITMDEEEVLDMPTTASGAKTPEALEKLLGTKPEDES